MTTKIFNSFEEFLAREDKTINGVSQEFANDRPDFEEINATNVGCWNCANCKGCKNCWNCVNCSPAHKLANNS